MGTCQSTSKENPLMLKAATADKCSSNSKHNKKAQCEKKTPFDCCHDDDESMMIRGDGTEAVLSETWTRSTVITSHSQEGTDDTDGLLMSPREEPAVALEIRKLKIEAARARLLESSFQDKHSSYAKRIITISSSSPSSSNFLDNSTRSAAGSSSSGNSNTEGGRTRRPSSARTVLMTGEIEGTTEAERVRLEKIAAAQKRLQEYEERLAWSHRKKQTEPSSSSSSSSSRKEEEKVASAAAAASSHDSNRTTTTTTTLQEKKDVIHGSLHSTEGRDNGKSKQDAQSTTGTSCTASCSSSSSSSSSSSNNSANVSVCSSSQPEDAKQNDDEGIPSSSLRGGESDEQHDHATTTATTTTSGGENDTLDKTVQGPQQEEGDKEEECSTSVVLLSLEEEEREEEAKDIDEIFGDDDDIIIPLSGSYSTGWSPAKRSVPRIKRWEDPAIFDDCPGMDSTSYDSDGSCTDSTFFSPVKQGSSAKSLVARMKKQQSSEEDDTTAVTESSTTREVFDEDLLDKEEEIEPSFPMNFSEIRDPKFRKRCKKMHKRLNHDPWDEFKKYFDEDVCDYIQDCPDICKVRFEFDSFSGHVFPLSVICTMGASVKAVRLACEAYPEAKDVCDMWIGTPLHFACSYKAKLDVIKYLAADSPEMLEKKNRFGRTPLHMACLFHANTQTIRYLICAYPDALLLGDKDACTPLHLACENGAKQDTVELLVTANPKTATKVDKDDSTPLHLACAGTGPNTKGVIKTLIETEPKALRYLDFLGQTPLHVLIKNDSFGPKAMKTIVELMVKASPQITDTLDDSGQSALRIARRRRLPADLMKMLEPQS